MKKLSLFIAFIIISMMGKVYADEGMWLPMFVERLNYVDMQKMGLQLTPEELYSINHSSLKDAVVGLSEGDKPRGFFCTGEIVSDNSLLFTNHHCGYSSIQKLSTVEHDYLTEGFWAKNFSEELPADGVSASFLIRMEDVTEQVFSAVSDTMDYMTAQRAIRDKVKELEEAASEDGKYNPVVSSFFEGNEYYMFVYQVYTDIRLVGAPPSSIGKFGGDTDNWMWPRHTGDFSIFRVYADADGNPAPYSPDNKPLTAKYHLSVSLDGIQANDFSMIWGYPGSTERYMTSYGIDYNVDVFYPIIYDIFKLETDVMDEFMQKDPAVNIMYADDHAGLANTWKNFEGQMIMLRKNKVAEAKMELENQFMEWVNEDSDRLKEYGKILNNLKSGYDSLSQVCAAVYYPNFAISAGPIGIAGKFESYVENVKSKDKEVIKTAKESLKEIDVDAFFAEKYQPLEEKFLIELLKLYKNKFEGDDQLTVFKMIDKKYKGDVEAFAKDMFTNSIFNSPESIRAFIEKPNVRKIEKDLAYIAFSSMIKQMIDNISVYRIAMMKIKENNQIFVKGLREFYAQTQPDKVLYPDANSSLRMSYGSVKDYQPADAISYDYICTANGILEKYKPGDYEFDAPAKLIELITNKDFGPYADKNGELVTCFLSTNDITGGNSGSPVMNGKGELIGLAFDGNWEAMSGDVNFEPKLQRTINVDIRYVLFVIDKFADAINIIDELEIHKNIPEPIRVEAIELSE